MATSLSLTSERYTAEAKSVMVRSHAGQAHTGWWASWLCRPENSVWDSTGVSQPGLSASPAHTVSVPTQKLLQVLLDLIPPVALLS